VKESAAVRFFTLYAHYEFHGNRASNAHIGGEWLSEVLNTARFSIFNVLTTRFEWIWSLSLQPCQLFETWELGCNV
jgi:hypothetical protein